MPRLVTAPAESTVLDVSVPKLAHQARVFEPSKQKPAEKGPNPEGAHVHGLGRPRRGGCLLMPLAVYDVAMSDEHHQLSSSDREKPYVLACTLFASVHASL